MNREIKFKLWCNDKKKMITNSYCICEDGVWKTWRDMEDGLTFNGVLLQYTGVKDKNGKEIYEGDIVSRMADRYDFNKPDGEDHWKEKQISFIEYRHNGFWVHDEDFGWEGENLWHWDTIEVIGNIYENPELLEKK